MCHQRVHWVIIKFVANLRLTLYSKLLFFFYYCRIFIYYHNLNKWHVLFQTGRALLNYCCLIFGVTCCYLFYAFTSRWIPYKACGRVIDGTRIICFKVPLRKVSSSLFDKPFCTWYKWNCICVQGTTYKGKILPNFLKMTVFDTINEFAFIYQYFNILPVY